MKILYTNKGSEVIVDDEIALKLKGYVLYEGGGGSSITVNIDNKALTLGKLVYGDVKDGEIVKRKDIKGFNFQKSNLTTTTKSKHTSERFKKQDIKYNGVTKVMLRGSERFLAYYYEGSKKITLGYYYTVDDAAIVREYTIRTNKINVVETNVDLSDDVLEKAYKEVVERTREIKKENLSCGARKGNFIKKGKYAYKWGIHEEGDNFCAVVYINRVPKRLGVYTSKEEAAIVRNCYIIENSLQHNPLYPMDKSIEEQFKIRETIKTYLEKKSELPKVFNKKSNGYKGLNKLKRKNVVYYNVVLRVNGSRVYIGNSRYKDLAAMMYNIYVLEKGFTQEIINDVGLSINEQKEKLAEKGYIFDGNSFKLKR